MKNTKDRIINKYIKNVVKLLPLSCREKIKKDLYTSISNAFEEDSVVSKELLSQQFGTPDSFAAEYLSAMDIAQLQTHLLRYQKQKRRNPDSEKPSSGIRTGLHQEAQDDKQSQQYDDNRLS